MKLLLLLLAFLTITQQQKVNTSQENSSNGQIKVMFFRTAVWYKNVIEGKLLRNGRYNAVFRIIEHLSHFCLGSDAIIEVRTDDTHFFSKGKGAWPSRPELEWFSDALKGDFERIYFIHYSSYPPVYTGKDTDDSNSDQPPLNPLMMCAQNGKNKCKSKIVADINMDSNGTKELDDDNGGKKCCDKTNTGFNNCKIWCTR